MRYFLLAPALLVLLTGCSTPSQQTAVVVVTATPPALGVPTAGATLTTSEYAAKARDVIARIEQVDVSMNDSGLMVVEKQGAYRDLSLEISTLAAPSSAQECQSLMSGAVNQFLRITSALSTTDQLRGHRRNDAKFVEDCESQGDAMLARAKTLVNQLSP